MDNENKYNIEDLNEYIRQGEPGQREKALAWQTAIGLQAVDGLKPSQYLLDTARRNIEGEISIGDAKVLIDTYYRSAEGRKMAETENTEEADKVSARINELLCEPSFNLSLTQLTSIHQRLFEGIYKFAGRIRDYDITKREWVLKGQTVYYASADTIRETVEFDLRQEREFSYAGLNMDDAIKHLTRFCADLWQVHAFGEGNTRTMAVFMIKYLRTLGFSVANEIFADNSWYFRNALVRANYTNLQENIIETTVYLERFFRSMLLSEHYVMRNRELHVDWKDDEQAVKPKEQELGGQSAKEPPPKCKNCTLEEVAVLRILQDNPAATQKTIAAKIGKSERTVKTITANLSQQGIIVRRNGKRHGYWEITE